MPKTRDVLPDNAGPRVNGAALLDKACDVLDAVGATQGGIGQAALAQRLGMPRTTLYRILAALVARGLLRQDPQRKVYAIGFRLLEMAQGAWSAADLPAAAAPELRALRDATGETAYIAVLEGGEAVALGKFEGAHEVRSAARLGQRKPLHCTSQGKAMLAFMQDAEREALLRRMRFAVLTPSTLRDRPQLEMALQIARARGYAIDDEEIVEGVRCVGAPVIDAAGKMLGAVSIAGPAFRMSRERLELLGPEVAAAGRRIGAALRPAAPAAAGVHPMPNPAGFQATALCWSAASQSLWWADALAPAVFVANAEGHGCQTVRWPQPIAALALAEGGGCLLADQGGGFARIAVSGAVSARRQLAITPPQALAVAPDGVLWGAMPTADGSASGIGPLAADGRMTQVWRLPGQIGDLAFGADGALYAAAASTGTIHRMETGRATPMLLTRLPQGGGRPCGLAIDQAGCIWTGLADGWSLARLSADGEIDRLVPLPVPRPTSLVFGGKDLATLYVTSSRHGLALDVLGSAPLSGRVFALTPGVAGLPQHATDWL